MARNGVAETGHLLVVDDNKVNRLLMGRRLEQQGHTVAFAENGRQALDMLRAAPPISPPHAGGIKGGFDLVLLDIEMPELDGYQVLEQLTADTRLRNIPVKIGRAHV